MFLLGWWYESGINTEKDLNKAEEWYLKAIEAGSVDAKEALIELKGIELNEYYERF